eukprot:11205574-Ditylum_brightwellii.AAC.1
MVDSWGDKIIYPKDVSNPTADTTVAKVLFNSTMSLPGVRFICVNIENFYLEMPMERAEYICFLQ